MKLFLKLCQPANLACVPAAQAHCNLRRGNTADEGFKNLIIAIPDEIIAIWVGKSLVGMKYNKCVFNYLI